MKTYPFNAAYSHAREFYGVELNPDEFESMGLIAWERIGNRQLKWYKFQVEPTEDSSGEYYIDLPCNVDFIEAVTANYEDYQKTSNQFLSGQTQTGWIESYIETRKYNTNHFYPSGKFIKYNLEGNKLILADRFNEVIVLYRGIVADTEGLPFLTTKEIEAIGTFCAYSYMFRAALMTRDSATLQLSQVLEQK